MFLAVNICLQCTNYSGDLALPEGGLYYSVTAAYRVMLLLCCIVIATFYYLITMLREGDIYFLLFFPFHLAKKKNLIFQISPPAPTPHPPKKFIRQSKTGLFYVLIFTLETLTRFFVCDPRFD